MDLFVWSDLLPAANFIIEAPGSGRYTLTKDSGERVDSLTFSVSPRQMAALWRVLMEEDYRSIPEFQTPDRRAIAILAIRANQHRQTIYVSGRFPRVARILAALNRTYPKRIRVPFRDYPQAGPP